MYISPDPDSIHALHQDRTRRLSRRRSTDERSSRPRRRHWRD